MKIIEPEDRSLDARPLTRISFEEAKPMIVAKRKAMHEPLLNAVARKLGHAAGTLAKATQELTAILSAIPENVSAEVRESARAGAPAGRFRARTRRPKTKNKTKKRIRRTTRTLAAASSRSQTLPKNKSPRSRPKASSSKK